MIENQVLEIATGRKELRERKQQFGGWEVGRGEQLTDVHGAVEPGAGSSSSIH